MGDKVEATSLEIKSFKILFNVANAINVINASYEKHIGNMSEETEMHLNAGLFGLSLYE